MAVVGRVLTHGRYPKTIVEGMTADCERFEEFWNGCWTGLFWNDVIVRSIAGEDGSCWRRLKRSVPGEIWSSLVNRRFCHQFKAKKKFSDSRTRGIGRIQICGVGIDALEGLRDIYRKVNDKCKSRHWICNGGLMSKKGTNPKLILSNFFLPTSRHNVK